MRASIKNIIVEISKRSNKLSADDINRLNSQLIQDISKLDYESNLNKVLLSNRDIEINDVVSTLEEHGIIVVPNFITPEDLKKINQLCNEIETLPIPYEDEFILCQTGGSKLNSYESLSNYPKTVINKRSGDDLGMLDIFNINLYPRYEELNLRQIIANLNINDLIDYGASKKLSNVNIYVNKGIRNTRGFHLDDNEHTLKAFIYLTDVNSLQDGPYCYSLGSHKDLVLRKLNKEISKFSAKETETPVVNFNSILPVLGKAGTLIISNQTGFHRGIPQSTNAERKVLVLRYQ